jgi:hypothetical protein
MGALRGCAISTDHICCCSGYISFTISCSLCVLCYPSSYNLLHNFDHRIGEQRHQHGVESEGTDCFSCVNLCILLSKLNHQHPTNHT